MQFQLGWLQSLRKELNASCCATQGQSQESRSVTKICYVFILKMGFVKWPLGELEEGKEIIVCNT